MPLSPMRPHGGRVVTVPNASQLAAVVKIGWLTLRGRHGDAAETLLRAAYSYRDGGTAGHLPRRMAEDR